MRRHTMLYILAAINASTGCGEVSPSNAADSAVTPAADANSQQADAAAPDALTHGPMTVTVYVDNLVAPGIAVQYHAADGSYLGTETTDTGGVASIAEFPVDGSITAPVSPGPDRSEAAGWLTSVLRLQPGDNVIVGLDHRNSFEPVAQITLTLPGTAVGGSDRYDAFLAGNFGSSVSPSETRTWAAYRYTYPTPPATVDAVAYARIGINADAVRTGYSTISDLPVEGVSPDLTASATFPAWKTDFTTQEVTVSNQPQNTTLGISMRQYKSGRQHLSRNAIKPAIPTEPWTYPHASGFFDATLVRTTLRHPSSYNNLSVNPGSVATGSTTVTTALDLTTDLYGELSNLAVSETVPHRVSWTLPGSCRDNPAGPDLVMVELVGNQDAELAYRWHVYAPYETSSVTAPQLDSGTAATLWPNASFTSVSVTGVGIVAYSDLGWADLREIVNDRRHWWPPTSSTTCEVYPY